MDLAELQKLSTNMRKAAKSILEACDVIDMSLGSLRAAFTPSTPSPGVGEAQGKPLIALTGGNGPEAKGQSTRLNRERKQEFVEDWRSLPRHRRFGKYRNESLEELAARHGIHIKTAKSLIGRRKSA